MMYPEIDIINLWLCKGYENMTQKQISVIVPTYKRKFLLERTLKSIYAQSYQNIQVVIINDNPDKEITQDDLDIDKTRDITISNNYENRGLASCRNSGMKHSTGDYFVFLDDDDILLPYALEFRMHMLNKLNADIVYTRALQDIWEKTNTGGYKSVHKQLYWDSPFDKDLILIQNIAPCCCPLFSRKAWKDSDYYKLDKNLDTSEDFDFWIALSRENYFHELKLIDCECSYRKNKTQMTGTRDFGKAYPIMYKRWRNTAKNLKWVTEHQNNTLKRMGFNPEDYGL